ncbi:MAG: periplasmic protein TonB [Hyphomicrobiales bacterium]|nr:periplasmic protein TonB [Hyphomicrobiales bacterium]
MTGGRQVHIGEVVALRRADDDRAKVDAAVPVRAERPWLIPEAANSDVAVDLSNVIPFRRGRTQDAIRGSTPDIVVASQALPARAVGLRERGLLGVFIVLSLLVHGGLLTFLWREPVPLASIGLPVISVEIVLGATAPAGIATAPGETETQAAAAPVDAQPTVPVRQAEQKATAQPQELPVAQQAAAPEQTTQLERQADEPQPNDHEPAMAPDPKPINATVETSQPDTATAPPRQPPPDTIDVTLLPQPEQEPVMPAGVHPVQQKPAPKQVQRKPEPEPRQRVAARPAEKKAAEPARIAAPTKDRANARATAAAPAAPANNLGVGRSDYDANYRGLVAAHLARHKQYPADARSSGKTGTAAVTFSIGGSGGVGSVSLARSSGVPSIDQEVVAMVRRASPFPPPPGGRPQSFTVPVNFSLR